MMNVDIYTTEMAMSRGAGGWGMNGDGFFCWPSKL